MEQSFKLRKNLQETVFFYTLIINAAVFPFSEALISISAGLLILQAMVFQSWHHPTVKVRSWKSILFPVSVFLIYCIGVLFTKDFAFALYELKKMAFWLIIPLAVFFSPKLSEKKVYIVLLIFVVAVFISSLIVAGRLLILDAVNLSEFRKLSIVSHIRFSIQVGCSLIIVAWFCIQKKYALFNIKSIWIIALLVWLVMFLFLLKSLVGILALLGTASFALVYYARNVKRRSLRILMITVFLGMIFFPVLFLGKVIMDFYDFKDIDPENIENITPSGNKYIHDFNQHMRENGHLVYVYICDDELRQEWNKRSEYKYDDDLNGYPLGSTLMRYLTSLGYRKDSAGVSKLSMEDIQLIEKGATNYKFKNHFFSIYPRIYETIWEIDDYIRTDDPNDKTLAQRIEYIKASIVLIKENPLFGIGTGNWAIKYNEAYKKMNTKLSEENWRPSHNQYLNYIVKFGLVGFIWILLAIVIPVLILGHQHNFIFLLFLIFIAFANLGDANLETHTGLSFFIFLYSFLLWNSTDSMKQKIPEI